MGYGVIGNTTDSGSVVLGSSPGTPALKLISCYLLPVGLRIVKQKCLLRDRNRQILVWLRTVLDRFRLRESNGILGADLRNYSRP